MHEQSLVRSLLAQVEQLRIEHGGVAVTCVEVEIGPLSGVEPLLVREAFELLVGESCAAQSELRIHNVPLLCHCRDCGADWSAESCRFVCPACQSNSVRILSGDEFRLRTINLQLSEPAEVSR
ncbi:MAG: hydrogenase maturation nickel metallochaperone HypA [Planctomycetaceae bacterium]|nr:hydrogenase maturation nickel metallochaperone HypA [Planctomycetaceae bacterium]